MAEQLAEPLAPAVDGQALSMESGFSDVQAEWLFKLSEQVTDMQAVIRKINSQLELQARTLTLLVKTLTTAIEPTGTLIGGTHLMSPPKHKAPCALSPPKFQAPLHCPYPAFSAGCPAVSKAMPPPPIQRPAAVSKAAPTGQHDFQLHAWGATADMHEIGIRGAGDLHRLTLESTSEFIAALAIDREPWQAVMNELLIRADPMFPCSSPKACFIYLQAAAKDRVNPRLPFHYLSAGGGTR